MNTKIILSDKRQAEKVSTAKFYLNRAVENENQSTVTERKEVAAWEEAWKRQL